MQKVLHVIELFFFLQILTIVNIFIKAIITNLENDAFAYIKKDPSPNAYDNIFSDFFFCSFHIIYLPNVSI